MLDFRQADLRDVRWWRRSRFLVRALAREEEGAVLRAFLALKLSLLGNGGLEPDSFKKIQEAARALTDDVVACLQPWASREEGAAGSELERLIETYKKTMGDPADPAYMAKVRADIEEFRRERRLAAESPEESDEARIARRTAERDRRVAERLARRARRA